MKTLYVSDLDGTLLNRDGKISDESKALLNVLLDQGLAFTFATARSIHSAYDRVKDLHISLPMIIYNGASMVMPNNHHLFYHKAFAKSDAHKLLQALLAKGQYPFVYAFIDGVERVSYMEAYLHDGGLHYLQQRKGDARFRKVTKEEDLFVGSIFYLTCIGEYDHLYPFYQNWKHDAYTITFQQELYRKEYWLELMAPYVSKAEAILKLKEMQQFDRIVCFGDAMNDRAMFSISDISCAVDNAIDELKELADEVILSNDQDGVARWLSEHASI